MNLLKGSLILKIIALAFAIATYFFIHHEIIKSEDKFTDPSYRLIKLTAKSLPLHVRLATAPPEGYRILMDQVSSNPSQVIVVGPEALLEEASSAETALVDVSENTSTVTKRIPVESVAGIHLAGEPYIVQVIVPIEAVKPKAESTN